MDSLLEQGHIDFIQYLERIPDEYVPKKEQLISEIKENMKNQQQQQDIPSLSIAYNDLPPAGQMQLAGLAGIQLTAEDMVQHMQAQQPPIQPMQGGQ
jgi:hypothetical protein